MKKITAILLMLISVITTTFGMQKEDKDTMSFENYEESWNKVKAFENEGKPKSALQEVKLLLVQARIDNNSPQLVKGLLHQFKYEMVVEENSELKIVNTIREEILSTDDVIAKSILQSILAQNMWQYYQENRYQFMNRTQTSVNDDKDFQTWDLARILQEVKTNYFASIEAKEILQSSEVSLFDPILLKQKESELYRPTIYDLLAHRAIDFFMNSESGLPEPVLSFSLDKDSYFQTAKQFSIIKLPKDIVSLDKDALEVFQDLLAFRLKDKNIKALVDTDLKRFNYLVNNGLQDDKNELYIKGLQNLAQQYKSDDITAYINYLIAQFWFNNSNATDEVKKDWRVKAYNLCNETIATYEDAMGAINCKVLLRSIQTKSISAEIENIVVPDEPFKTLVQYQNINKAYFKIVRLSEDEIGSNYNYNDRDKWINKLINRSAIKEWSVNIKDPKDYFGHSTELKIDGIPEGAYVLLISHDEFDDNVSLVTQFWSSDISYVTRSKSKGGLEVYVTSRKTGQPLVGAVADAYYKEYNYDSRKNVNKKVGTFTADNNGLFIIKSTPNRNQNVFFDISYKSDRLNEAQNHYVYQYREPHIRWSTNTHFFTDRAIYRPGQTIYFKGIMLKNNGETATILANTSTSVTLRDVNYQEIAVLQLKTNDYGSFQGSFTAPSSGLLGSMTIIGQGGQKQIKVEEYKRPTFEVILDTLEGSYSLNQEVEITGKATSYAGAPIIESKVKYRVVREVVYPYWHWWSWRRPAQSSGSKEITNGKTITEKDGSYSIKFETVPDLSVSKESQPQFRYTVYVDVIDLNGETRSGEKTVTAGYVGLNLNVTVPENWNRDKTQSISVGTTNLDGREEAANVTLKLYRLVTPKNLKKARKWNSPDVFTMTESEHAKWFPNEIYDDEMDMEHWEKQLVKTYTINTGEKTALQIEPSIISSSGMYWMEGETKDDGNNSIKSKSSFVAYSSSDTKLAKPEQLKVSLDNTSYLPGTQATLSIGTSIKNARVIYLLSFNGQIIERQYLQLNNEIKKFKIPIKESQRGGLQVICLLVHENRVYSQNTIINIPFEERDLQVEWMTFRDLLEPGQKEQWKVKIKGPKGDAVASELLAGMYDKSLDYFVPHNFNFGVNLNPYISNSSGFDAGRLFGKLNSQNWRNNQPPMRYSYGSPNYDQLNLFGFYLNRRNYRFENYYESEAVQSKRRSVNKESFGYANGAPAPAMVMEDADGISEEMDMVETPVAELSVTSNVNTQVKGNPDNQKTDANFAPRKNLNETAFFFPQLETNAEGEVIIDFTMPEALTTWKFLGFAHNKELEHQIFTKEIKTQKELMVTPNVPRFFREGDKIILTSKIDNLSDYALNGQATLTLKDALTNEVVDNLLLKTNQNVNFSVDEKGSTVVKWELSVPKGLQAVNYIVQAKAGTFTDGVTSTVPVLTNRMMVTETMPVWLKKAGSRTFTFKGLKENDSKTLEHHQLTMEYTSNPAWYAVQALPYLMEFTHECTEQLFSRYYANTLAEHIAISNPRIQEIFEQWKSADSDALISNLEKNQELKALLIEETPWLRNAQNETERKKRIALLFDLNRMANEKAVVLEKILDRQTPNGGFTWFPGMRDNRYITQHILSDIAHLKQLNVSGAMDDPKVQQIIARAIPYLDARIAEDLRDIKKYHKNWKKENHLNSIQIHYLYMRAHFKEIPIQNNAQEAFDYFLAQADKYWLKRSFYDQGMIAIALHGYDKVETAQKIMASIKENSIVNDEMGMYWKAIEQGGYYWYNAPIEAHSLLIEAFHTVMNDQDAVNEMKVWLLKQKQVQDWKTTKATSEAMFALLLRGEDWLANTKPVEIRVAKKVVDPTQMNASYEPGTGYFKVKWNGESVTKDMAEVTVTSETNAPSWGAMYWQYFEDLDQITTFEETPLQLKKSVYVETVGNSGPVITPIASAPALQPGDKLKVRIELRVDRNMEYIHMKDMRASGLEPINVLSQYKYQDGLGYYESTKDAATHFFIDYLPKGTYVFEYPLRVTHEGDFSNGITTIQSMYAPEFSSHSEGIRLEVKK